MAGFIFSKDAMVRFGPPRCSEPSLSQRPCLACEFSSAGGQAALGGRGEREEQTLCLCIKLLNT